jgi:hypothetical protein
VPDDCGVAGVVARHLRHLRQRPRPADDAARDADFSAIERLRHLPPETPAAEAPDPDRARATAAAVDWMVPVITPCSAFTLATPEAADDD